MMRLLSALLIPALLAVALPAQKISDTIRKKDGARLRGVEVTSVTLQSVKYKKGADELELPGHQLAGIDWSGAPDSFAAAATAMARGDYEGAKQLYGDAAEKADRAVLKTEAKFLQCKAAVAAAATSRSTATDAAGALRAWMTEAPDHWRLPEAMLLVGRALRLANLGADAEQALQELADRSSRDGWGGVWNARARYEMALAQLDQGKAGDARGSFQAASGAAESALLQPSADDAELRNIKTNAKVGEGETYITDKNYAQAMSFFGSLANAGDPALAAAAKAGEGQAILLQAEAEKKVADLRTAQIALATACVLDTGTGETGAKANYYLGLCIRALGAEHEGENWNSRANAYFQLVTKYYPTTRWASLAATALTK